MASSPCGGACKVSWVVSGKGQVGETWNFRLKERIEYSFVGVTDIMSWTGSNFFLWTLSFKVKVFLNFRTVGWLEMLGLMSWLHIKPSEVGFKQAQTLYLGSLMHPQGPFIQPGLRNQSHCPLHMAFGC